MSKIKYFLQQSWLLIVASFCFGLLIAATNAALSERINYNTQKKLNDLMKGLITDANDFEKAIPDVVIDPAKGTKTDVYKAVDRTGRVLGFAYVAEGSGFADKIKLVVALDGKCEKFLGFKVLFSNETPGFGSRIGEDFFSSQFKDAPAAELTLVKAGEPSRIDSEIVAISGATVSSEAVIKTINNSIEKIKQQIREKGLIGNDQ